MKRTRWFSALLALLGTIWVAVRRLKRRFDDGNARHADADIAIREGRTDAARLEALYGSPHDPTPLG